MCFYTANVNKIYEAKSRFLFYLLKINHIYIMKYLKKTHILLSFLSMSLLVFCYCSPFDFGDDDKKAKKILKNVKRTLTYLHYAPQKIDDDFSQKVYDSYMESLDPYKTYFKNSDVEFFNQYEDKMDDFFNDEDLTFYHQSVDTLYHRIDELKELTEDLLSEPLDYNAEETLSFDYENTQYPSEQNGWKNNWKKRLKYNILQEILFLEKSAKDSALWAKRDSIGEYDDFDPRKKQFAQLEVEARKEIKENMSEFFRRFQKRKKNDWLSLYVNAYTENYDPHTAYFSPKENEDFEMNMSGQLEGIGATLADEKGNPTIKSLVVGGPAWKQGELEVDDKITKVAQGEKGEPVNVTGMLLDDAIRLIRGKKGSVVVLTVKKKDGSLKEISIERDIVELEETFARSAVIEDETGEKFGIIYLPSFYLNYDGKGHDASDDIKKEIEELKKEGIQGLIFDVRSNGGGDLAETVEIVGHFIEEGPVVQVVRSDGDKKVYKDKDDTISWEGPMVVMVNEMSASASEILAAALQDYKRAVILGSPKTYGKGTVQTVRPLSIFSQTNDELGVLKFTIQKFYRINGGSTQLKGVNSDIVIPDRYTYTDLSEASQDAALAWDQIEQQKYDAWNLSAHLDEIKANSQKRLSEKPQIQMVDEYAHWVKKMEDDKTTSLNYQNFKNSYETREKQADKYEELSKYKNGLNILSPTYETQLVKEDTILKERRETWHKNLEKDLYLEEAVYVLEDMLAGAKK